MLRNASWLIAICAGLAFAAAPAFAAEMPMKKADMPAKHHHRMMSCYDHAWQSQEMKDCLDKKPEMASDESAHHHGMHHHMHHGMHHAAAHHAAHHHMHHKKPMGDTPEKKS